MRPANLPDFISASREVILGLAASPGGGAVVASLLSGLANALGEEPEIRFLRFEGEADDGALPWPSRLREGASGQRDAKRRSAARQGFPDCWSGSGTPDG